MKPRLKTGLLGTLSLISKKQLRNKAAADEGERERAFCGLLWMR